jgi:hypothetical protein
MFLLENASKKAEAEKNELTTALRAAEANTKIVEKAQVLV